MKVHNLTICDQVRQEINGKFFLIGVYLNGLIVPQLPATFPLTVWLLLESEIYGDTVFKFRAYMPETRTELFRIEGDINVVDLENWTPIGFGGNVSIGKPGTIAIEAMFGDESEWTTLRTLFVRDEPFVGVGEQK
ncbi:hypothetical protein HF263_04075 [Rhizobium leguminosarum]|uniref:DUF6941 family protein n=1 Tax=Rhizobium leguminosarum TaxID=384 RepID=UPI001C916753|nr:hypothetical protein [Rhizobium leguminosarum]MBY2993799.1 hypothetical protein [Rhizobium leguminosarum]MBY3055249.1 hypothetical protein [Rhizobium leguminosarum]